MVFKKQQGSALLFVLIVALALTTIMFGAAYKSKIDKLSIEALNDKLNNNVTARNYFENYMANNDVAALIGTSGFTESLVGFKHNVSAAIVNNQLVDSGSPYDLANALAGQAMKKASSSMIKIQHIMMSADDKKLVSKDKLGFVSNGLTNDFYTATTATIIPINIPFVRKDKLLSNQLNASNGFDDVTLGYVGAIKKTSGSTNLWLYNSLSTESGIIVPSGYFQPNVVSVGVDLVDGDWYVFLAIVYTSYSSENAIFVSKTSLNKLKTNLAAAAADLSNFSAKMVANKAVTIIEWVNSPTGMKLVSSRKNSSQAYQYRDVYSYSESNGLPALTFEASSYYQRLDIYNGNSSYILPKSEPGSLNVNDVLIITDTNHSGRSRKLSSDGINYGMVVKAMKSKPALAYVDSEYIFVAADNSDINFYTYDGSLTDATNVLSLIHNETLPEAPKQILIRYGYYFVVTSNHIYMYNKDYSRVDEIDFTSTNTEILYDNDQKKIYALSNALSCKVANNCNINNRAYFTVSPTLTSSSFYSRNT